MPDPIVVFEVLSRGTARTDRVVKNREYAATASIRRYIMLEQNQVLATSIGRTATGWDLETLGAGGVLSMPEIGVQIPMAELYDGLDLAPADP